MSQAQPTNNTMYDLYPEIATMLEGLHANGGFIADVKADEQYLKDKELHTAMVERLKDATHGKVDSWPHSEICRQMARITNDFKVVERITYETSFFEGVLLYIRLAKEIQKLGGRAPSFQVQTNNHNTGGKHENINYTHAHAI